MAECFDDISYSDVLDEEQSVEEALDVITKAYHDSPYAKDKILDNLKLAKIID